MLSVLIGVLFLCWSVVAMAYLEKPYVFSDVEANIKAIVYQQPIVRRNTIYNTINNTGQYNPVY